MHYFAYGSNLSSARFLARLPAASRTGVYRLPGHELRLHKVGSDGSAKCDAFPTGDSGHGVLGVVYRISTDELVLLDRIEGLGYRRQEVVLQHAGGMELPAMTYIATRIDPGLLPYDWYLNHVLVGAREADFPAAYRASLEALQTIADPERRRAAQQWAIHAAAGSG